MRVFISSPYRGDIEKNMEAAAGHAVRVLALGLIPVVPHYAFHYLEGVENGEFLALYLCCREIETCDEVWTFGRYSEGMSFECAYARGIAVPVHYGPEQILKREGV